MEAAKQLLQLGYAPVIIEKADHLGGHVAEWNRLFPDMTPAQDLIRKLAGEISEARVLLKTDVIFVNRLKDGFNLKLSNGETLYTRAILLATGFRLFEAARKEEYGYGVYDKVVTNRDLERWFNGLEDERIDSSPKRKIGFVHCVGSRDVKAGNSQCSKVCCVTAIKQAIELKEKNPDAEIYCFYMDLRLFGKKYEDFYINAQKDYGIHFIRGRVSEVCEDINGNLVVKAEDTLNGKPVKVTLDLLVLMAGMLCNPAVNNIAAQMSVDVDTDGFLKSRDNVYSIMESDRRGVFLAGACTGTKTVPETVAEARAAVLSIFNYLQQK